MPSKFPDIDQLMCGSIDMHLHPGPDSFKCRVDTLEAARQAKQAGMKAFVAKNHYFSTAPVAIMVNQLVPDFKVFGSICLDYEVGGLNARALEVAAQMGARLVWMPTFSSSNSRDQMRRLGLPLEGAGYSILDKDGQLVPEIYPILKLVKRYDMVLASGHISPTETFALEKAARKEGIWRFIVTHPLDIEFFAQPFEKDDLIQLARNGAYIECTFVTFLPSDFRHDPAHMADIIKTVGAQQCVLGTDLGQSINPLPVEGMRMLLATLIKHGITEDEINLMCKTNPGKLLGLDA